MQKKLNKVGTEEAKLYVDKDEWQGGGGRMAVYES